MDERVTGSYHSDSVGLVSQYQISVFYFFFYFCLPTLHSLSDMDGACLGPYTLSDTENKLLVGRVSTYYTLTYAKFLIDNGYEFRTFYQHNVTWGKMVGF